MSREIIAVIQLQPGQGGYYDDLSRIHLTIGNPRANVYAGTNCTQLRRSLKAGRLKLVTGSLGTEAPPFKLIRKGTSYILQPNNTNEYQTNATPVKTTNLVAEEPFVESTIIGEPSTPLHAEAPAIEDDTTQENSKEDKPPTKRRTRKAKPISSPE